MFFEDNIDDAKYCGHLYGLGTTFVTNGQPFHDNSSTVVVEATTAATPVKSPEEVKANLQNEYEFYQYLHYHRQNAGQQTRTDRMLTSPNYGNSQNPASQQRYPWQVPLPPDACQIGIKPWQPTLTPPPSSPSPSPSPPPPQQQQQQQEKEKEETKASTPSQLLLKAVEECGKKPQQHPSIKQQVMQQLRERELKEQQKQKEREEQHNKEQEQENKQQVEKQPEKQKQKQQQEEKEEEEELHESTCKLSVDHNCYNNNNNNNNYKLIPTINYNNNNNNQQNKNTCIQNAKYAFNLDFYLDYVIFTCFFYIFLMSRHFFL